MSKKPVTARYAPTGASAKPSPKTRWQKAVKRLVYEYPKITNNATGLNTKQIVLIK